MWSQLYGKQMMRMRKVYLVVIFMILLMTLSGCRQTYFGEYTYRDFDHLDHWTELDDLGHDRIDMVYYYDRDFFGTPCPGCKMVNESIFLFGQENTLGVHLTLVNEREVQGLRPVGVRTAPRLILIENGEITHNVMGAGPIFEWLEALDKKQFELPYYDPPHQFEYRDFETFSLSQLQSLDNEDIIVYAYLEVCAACQLIKQDVLHFIDQYNGAYTVYIWDLLYVSIPSEYSDFPTVVPSIIVFESGDIIATYKGVAEVIDYLDTLHDE